jgi:hypothetical protein
MDAAAAAEAPGGYLQEADGRKASPSAPIRKVITALLGGFFIGAVALRDLFDHPSIGILLSYG